VAFFGTVLADEVDVAAVDAAWGKRGACVGVVPQAGAGLTMRCLPVGGGRVDSKMGRAMRMVWANGGPDRRDCGCGDSRVKPGYDERAGRS